MKNAGIAGGLVAIGIGLTTIGLSNFQGTKQAHAAPAAAAVNHGPEEPTIVWYGVTSYHFSNDGPNTLYRAWSDGTVEARSVTVGTNSCSTPANCSGWGVIASPTEGLNAAADINLDEIVNGEDLAMLLGKWGAAPRNPMPPSDCPLGLLNPS